MSRRVSHATRPRRTPTSGYRLPPSRGQAFKVRTKGQDRRPPPELHCVEGSRSVCRIQQGMIPAASGAALERRAAPGTRSPQKVRNRYIPAHKGRHGSGRSRARRRPVIRSKAAVGVPRFPRAGAPGMCHT